MEAMIFRFFAALFRLVGVLLITGTLVTAIADIQKRAFNSRRIGLVSLLQINQQLVGKTK